MGEVSVSVVVRVSGSSRFAACLASLVFFLIFTSVIYADNYDVNNYPPIDNTIKLESTNLPIVFIDTRCGDTVTHAIHRYDRIAARMKIVNNDSGVNFGDTITHPHQTIDYEGWVAIRYRGNTSFNWSAKKPYNFKTMKTAIMSHTLHPAMWR